MWSYGQFDFNKANFEKCRRMKMFREKKQFKYDDISFPTTMSEYPVGYI